MDWNDTFLDLYDRCLEKYKAGDSDYNTYYSDSDLSFLSSIGYKPRELFDFVEDNGDGGVPTRSTALLVAAVRRDYLTVVQDGAKSSHEISKSDLPAFDEELDGIAYLPRIIAKATAKLKGELNPDIMYGCGGDRKFLKNNGNIPMADFLRNLWAADGDQQKVADYVKSFQK